MKSYIRQRALLLATGVVLLAAAPANPQGAARPTPRLQAVAETRLIMEAIDQANFRGLERLLKQRPADVESWTFARGQALLIAESGNLLLLRPPKTRGEDSWMERSMELRTTATRLARSLAKQDFETSRAMFAELASSCNRCHQTFQVQKRIIPFGGREKLAPEAETP